jgi:biopolymer transport protein ExbD
VPRRHTYSEDHGINVTPMLDVVFILLIFFIVAASFTRETGVTIERPTAVEAAALQNAAVLIGIRSNDDIWMAGQRVELAEVRHMAERARAENPEGSVVIVADKGSQIGTVTGVLDQLSLAGVEGVDIAAALPEG